MDSKIILSGVLAMAGWLYMYLFGRQLIFNFKVAYPLIKNMQAVQAEIIADTSKKYTTVSVVTMLLFMVIGAFLVIRFLPLYLQLFFLCGALICFFMIFSKIKPQSRSFFDSFCTSYYRFVPDDELRTAMFNKKPSQMKLRLHDMDLSTAFIPDFE